MPGTYETACQGKDKHPTYKAAKNQAKKRTKHPSMTSNKRLNVYRCDYCGQYHVGNSSQNKRYPYKRTKYRQR